MKGSFVLLLVLSMGMGLWKHAGGARYRAREPGAEAALEAAIAAGDVEGVRRCMRNSAAAATGELDAFLLRMAAWHGQERVVRLLVEEYGVDVNTPAPGGWSPLMMAVLAGKREAVEALLAAGADAEARSEAGATPLGVAIERGHDEIVERLLEAGSRGANRAGEGAVSFAR